MKAYLDLHGFTKMVEVPEPYPKFVTAFARNGTMSLTEEHRKDPRLDTLTFDLIGTIGGEGHEVLLYKWDGNMPRRGNES